MSKTSASVSSGVADTEKQMIYCFEVSGTPDETLALVFDILDENLSHVWYFSSNTSPLFYQQVLLTELDEGRQFKTRPLEKLF